MTYKRRLLEYIISETIGVISSALFFGIIYYVMLKQPMTKSMITCTILTGALLLGPVIMEFRKEDISAPMEKLKEIILTLLTTMISCLFSFNPLLWAGVAIISMPLVILFEVFAIISIIAAIINLPVVLLMSIVEIFTGPTNEKVMKVLDVIPGLLVGALFAWYSYREYLPTVNDGSSETEVAVLEEELIVSEADITTSDISDVVE